MFVLDDPFIFNRALQWVDYSTLLLNVPVVCSRWSVLCRSAVIGVVDLNNAFNVSDRLLGAVVSRFFSIRYAFAIQCGILFLSTY